MDSFLIKVDYYGQATFAWKQHSRKFKSLNSIDRHGPNTEACLNSSAVLAIGHVDHVFVLPQSEHRAVIKPLPILGFVLLQRLDLPGFGFGPSGG